MDKEKRAAADAAKRQAADAKQKADAAGGTDANLNKAASDAQADAERLEAAATAPSHDPKQGQELSKREKIAKRMEILREQYIAEGGDPKEFDADDLEPKPGATDDKPVTTKDLERLGVIKSADQMAAAIADADLRTAVQEELGNISSALAPEERYRRAVAIAASGKNARVAAEAMRVGARIPQTHFSGGVPPKDEGGTFEATPQEQTFMKKYGLTKEDIIASRRQAQRFDFGQEQK